MVLVIAVVGIVVIAALGFLGRRRPAADLAEWTVAGRKFGVTTMWLLQAGEVFTTFTFLGTAGLVASSGAASFYSMPYVPLGYIVLYFLAPLIWRRARKHGYLTQADFFEGTYRSRTLGIVVAVLGVVFLLPYLQLQITGLGKIVQLATGDKTSGDASMVIAFVLVVAFVLWSGLHGVATTSYFKDALMLIVLIVTSLAIPIGLSGGFTQVFHRVAEALPGSLYVHTTGDYDVLWYISNMAISTIGVAFATLPHQWPALMAARSATVLRKNYVWLPIYNTFVVLPLVVGYVGLLVLKGHGDPDATMLALASQALPPWLLGVVVVAGIATAMVPSAGLLIAISSLVARNLARAKSPKAQFRVNQATVVVATAAALVLGLVKPDALANLLLLTFSGLDQLAPAIGSALLFKRNVLRAPAALAGIVAGEVVVIFLTFAPADLAASLAGTVNVGLIGLAVNLVVAAVVEAVHRRMAPPPAPELSAAAVRA
ncbi:MAG TPA: sodium:solute symporter family protein [Streptosporangiaceae bacterium]|jgi:SSS family solute:Na+ symporter